MLSRQLAAAAYESEQLELIKSLLAAETGPR